jgi:imidazolonepropionase-like amidohydrolase
MPGLIDCHVHVIATSANLGANALLPDSLVAAKSAGIMRGMLMRGFTTVRDMGGADIGLRIAIEEGHFVGPRLVICGKALSQTGGHTDYRGPSMSGTGNTIRADWEPWADSATASMR